jgi:hypothetical protein
VPVVGSRFLIESGFIIAVAVVAGAEGLGAVWITALVGAAWAGVAVVEITLRTARRARAGARTQPLVEAQSTAPTVTVQQPQPSAEPETVPEPPHLTSVPVPPSEPEPVVEREPEPLPDFETADVLAFATTNHAPREWNLWELERAARNHGGDDVQAEERAYLLMYLREFAGPDGVLPADFDGLVRDAFGDVLHSVGA